MSRLAHFLGRDVTERVFLQRFLQLCSSSMFYIRKMCAASFGDFCAVVGTEAYEYNLVGILFYPLFKSEIYNFYLFFFL